VIEQHRTNPRVVSKITYNSNNSILFDTEEKLDLANSLNRTTQFNYGSQSSVSSIWIIQKGVRLIQEVTYDANDKIRSSEARTFTYDALFNLYGGDSTYIFFKNEHPHLQKQG
jgi:hypothetical protein